ncbi:MAG TPA: Gx transporter family protein [Gammaproteobacteria bacterium]|nr:Gx transporter family protein [Gammaproteobacteria bacterium]
MNAVQTSREDHLIAWFAALAITVHIVEGLLPSPLPGIKPGLANIITLTVMLTYGWRMAVWVAMLRVLVGSLIIGTFLSPTFMLSFSGALAGILALGIGRFLPGRGLGPVGYSVLASMAHMSAQFWVAYTLFIPHEALFRLLPAFMTAAVIFGLVNGIIVHQVLLQLRK